jgi:methylenetetrahydrofolate dehydrogenase (NADP+)/methenyltetrahydrofolate cyclohydrolase
MIADPTKLLDGKTAAAEIRAEVAQGVRDLVAAGYRRPGLAVLLAGDHPASQVYVASKVKACGEAGIESRSLRLPATATAEELTGLVDGLNRDDAVDGILVQLPLPAGIPERRVLDRVLPAKDVDGFHAENVGRLWLDQEGFVPATPSGILELLRRRGVPLVGRRAVVVGRSAIVGKPMAALLLREHCTVTVCHSRTADLAAVTREADVLVAAIGRPAILGPEHVKPGAVVVDVGINRVADRAEVERLFPGDAERLRQLATRGSTIVGDVDFTRVAPLAAAITPVPGGVGPLTVAMLLVNTLTAARRRQGLPALPRGR